ncbi:ATP synthase subunit g [Ophiocordyceps camponoti-floridani]|uniref:ATP synthase subunit g n=1 Tax=Ophiocordyceps camponoti-floridani TaxID=2030778 RepID=A0A8H4QAF7_9HYPO|nr:ATP synthase subunit g [Ophiocordyceps camponoti-floridani]
MKSLGLILSALVSSCAIVAAYPVSPRGPCDPLKVDQILLGKLQHEVCCSYGRCGERFVLVSPGLDVCRELSRGLVTRSGGQPGLTRASRAFRGRRARLLLGWLIAFAERQTPLVVYYSKVGLEMSKIVFQAQKMTPPQ